MQDQQDHGKSEFIITYILSLALNYHPDDISFVLIDYKGGGLTGAFKNGELELPHIVGTITNIDTEGLQRSLISINSEVKRRQILFNKAREIANNGTIDIYKYQKLYHSGIISEPLPHLLIICDEFAELKQQQPDFMAELVSISRIGRSLGVHLILATQKPSGIVDDQIRSNSKFAVCLKVQDKSDSSDVIGTDKAAFLKQAGRFYFKVGNDEYFMLGQSGWAGAPYIPQKIAIKQGDNIIQFISNTGKVIKEVSEEIKVKAKSEGEQLTNIVKTICNLAIEENYHPRKLWLEKLNDNMYLRDLKNKYKYKNEQNTNDLIIGEYDDPANQYQGLVKVNIENSGNMVIYGSVDSGKETLLNTMIWEFIHTYLSNELWIYILDFGSETFKIWKDAPHVGDVILSNDVEKTIRFFKMIKEEMDSRKEILSDYNGDYEYYRKITKKDMPVIVTFINGFDNFSEKYIEAYDELLLALTREGPKYGIIFICISSTVNDFRYRLLQNFKKKIVLNLIDEGDYSSVFNEIGKRKLPHIFGRGFIEIGEGIFEFQTAKICEAEDYNTVIKTEIDKIKENNKVRANEIKILPKIVKLADLTANNKIEISNFPIGIISKDLQILNYNFKKNFITLITSKNIEDAALYANNIGNALKSLNNMQIVELDYENIISNSNKTAEDTYDELYKSLDNKKETNDNICIILYGVEKFINYPRENEDTSSLDGMDGFDFTGGSNSFDIGAVLKEFKEKGIYNFIFVENAPKIKEYCYEDWYRKNIESKNIIWVGNGFSEQYILEIHGTNRDINDNCGRTFGYVELQNKTNLVKLLGMLEEETSNE